MTFENSTKTAPIPRDVILFLVIMYLLSGIAMYTVIDAGDIGVSGGFFAVLGMWSPGIAALAASLASSRSLKAFGWGWGRTKYQVLSFLIPLGYITLNCSIVWMTGLGGVADKPLKEMLDRMVTAALPWNTLVYVMVLGEEIGWSGYLVPRLAEFMSYRNVAVARGLIWSTWHAPLILGGVYGPERLPVLYQLTTFTVMAFCVSFIYVWMRLVSGSLWTGVLLHASHNKYIQGVFPRFTTDTGSTVYVEHEFSLILMVMMIGIAAYLWMKGKDYPFPFTGNGIQRSI